MSEEPSIWQFSLIVAVAFLLLIGAGYLWYLIMTGFWCSCG